MVYYSEQLGEQMKKKSMPSQTKTVDEFKKYVKQMLIPSQTKTVDELKEYATCNWHAEIKLNDRVRYMSIYEQERSEILKDDWDYYINSHGYRENWRLEKHTKKIGFFGCSCTFGIGTHHDAIFSSVVEKHYGSDIVESLNMGLPGSGIQRIAKLVSAANRIIDFDTVVLTLPTSSRFLVLDDTNLMCDVVPGFVKPSIETQAKFIHGEFGQNNLDMYFIDYVHWIMAELKSTRRVLWSTWCKETYKILESIIDQKDLLPMWHFVDKGRDPHPGVQSHFNHATAIIEKLGKI